MIEGITKKQGTNGKPVYQIDGREIEIYVSDFEWVLDIELQKINSMFQAILNAECDDCLDMNFAYIGKDLIKNLENIESDISHQMNSELKIVQNSKPIFLPNKKKLKEDSIIDVFIEPINGKAPVTEPVPTDSSGA